MSERTVNRRERELIEKAHKFLPGGSLGNMFSDVVMEKGAGSKIWDISGNEYIDYLIGSGPMVIGHGHPEVITAVREQLELGSTFFANNEKAILLAEEIVNAVPCAEQIRFSSSGTEATLFAMRAARAYRGKDKILKFEGGFHGMNDYALMSMGPQVPAEFPHPVPDSAGIPRSVQDDMLIAPFNDLETSVSIIERYHDELGGVIVEPFQRLLPPVPGFLEGLRDVTHQYGIPLIFDEIVTGFRFAFGGAQEFYKVTPDLCTLGKIVAGGYPLSAVAGSADILSPFNPASSGDSGFMPQIGTLSGNPIAAAAGLATINILKREGTYEKLFSTGQELKDNLQRLLNESEIPAKVIGEAPLFDVFFTNEEEVVDYRDTLKADTNKLQKFNELLFKQGIFKGGSKFYISLAHTREDIDKTIAAFASAIEELKGY